MQEGGGHGWGFQKDDDARKDLSESFTKRGMSLRDAGYLESALDDFDKALELDPANIDAWNNNGCVLGEMADCADKLEKIDREEQETREEAEGRHCGEWERLGEDENGDG